MEAMVRTHGFAGVRDVATLITGLAEEYWGSLFPRFDQDEYEALETHPTVAAISGLNGASVLPFAINRIILIRASPCGPLTGIDYLDAFDSQVRVKREQFETAARAVPPATFDVLYDDALAALAAYRKMTTLLSDKCQQSDNVDGPSGSAIEAVLDDSVRRIRHISGRPETSDADLSPTEGLETGAAGGDFSTSSPMSSNGSLQSRAEAYEMLQKVADFFSRTEPHSPVCASLLRIVSWRNLSFPELMMELVDHHDARRELFRLTGVREEQS
jgi:type VI secretion system protein ImpA